MKIIRAHWPNGTNIEHEREDFMNVYSQYSGKDVQLYLDQYRQSKTGIGYEFVASFPIGNCKNKLTNKDYWAAYDKMI